MTTSSHDHAPRAQEGHPAGHGPGPASWAMAASATLHCLTGCGRGHAAVHGPARLTDPGQQATPVSAREAGVARRRVRLSG